MSLQKRGVLQSLKLTSMSQVCMIKKFTTWILHDSGIRWAVMIPMDRIERSTQEGVR